MGITYSAVKTQVPEAWYIGKDYYCLIDLFPPCQEPESFFGLSGILKMFAMTLPMSYYIGPTPFVVSNLYPTADDMIARMAELRRSKWGNDKQEIKHMRAFYEWAGSDPLQLISEFDDLEEHDTEEYQLCVPPRQYRYMDGWGGEAGRSVGYDLEEGDEETG